MKQNFLLRVAALFSAIGCIVLPPASYSGYPIFSLEFFFFAFGVLALAILLAKLLRQPAALGLVLGLIISAYVALYYYAYLHLEMIYLTLAAAAVVGACALACRWDQRSVLAIVSVSFLSQLAIAVFETPPQLNTDYSAEVEHSDLPPVIHIVLDEHGGLGAIPNDERLFALRDRLQNRYLEAGFTLFPWAFSSENETQKSIPRLFNPGLKNPDSVVESSRGATRHEIQKFSLIDELAEDRAIDIRQFDYVIFDEEKLPLNKLASRKIYNTFTYYEAVKDVGFPLSDRLHIATASALNWLYFTSKLPPVVWFFDKSSLGRRALNWMFYSRWAYPAVGKAALETFLSELECCGKRGTYYFVHVYFPHMPYMFDDRCLPRSPVDWKAVWKKPIDKNFDKSGYDRYIYLQKAALQQALCASQKIVDVTNAVRGNPKLADSIIVVHSDHGNRVGLKSLDPSSPKYKDDQEKRDQFGAFLAVNWPDRDGSIDNNVVRIDRFFARLVDSDFSSSGATSGREVYPDAPY